MNTFEFAEREKQLRQQYAEGKVHAYKELGDLYLTGVSGEDWNYQDAVPLYREAADKGDVSAAVMAGMMLMRNEGGNSSDALPYLLMGVKQGIPSAHHWVGSCYENGIGCRKDLGLAEKYYRTAALMNDADAQLKLGHLLYKKTKSQNNNDYEFFHWFSCAHLNGNQEASEVINGFIRNSGDTANAKLFWKNEFEMIKKYGIDPSNRPTEGTAGGCYIATAVYGSYDAPEVMTLRRFRDEVLLHHWWGKVFVKIYYKLSPSVANRLNDSRRINSFVKKRLDSFVRFLCKQE